MTQLSNRTLFTGDNLPILRGINSNSVDLIYLDPPFNSNATYSAPVGSAAAGAAFKDSWTLSDVDAEWHGQIADEHPGLYKIIDAAGAAHSKGMQAYLIMMGVRMIEMQRILHPTGSIYLHCDPTAGAYLKTMMDAVFGRTKFRNEIIWHYNRFSRRGQDFPRMHDVILRYSSGEEVTYHKQFGPLTKSSQLERDQGYSCRSDRVVVYDESAPKVVQQRATWEAEGREIRLSNPPDGVPIGDTWAIPYLNSQAKERTGYPTQKPLALLERIIRASTNEGDYVFDPFCGCATTLVAAEKLSRKWGGGADLSDLAVKLVKQRIKRELGGLLFDVIHRTGIPKRTDQGKLPPARASAHRLYGEQEGHCKACGTHFPFRVMHVDHIVPRAAGGGDEYSNLQMLCSGCNVRKGTGTHEQLLAHLRADGILQE